MHPHTSPNIKKLLEASDSFCPGILNEIKDYAIFFLDVEGKILTWNKGCAIIKQYEAEETIGKFFGFLFTDEDQKIDLPHSELEITRNEGRYESEAWRKKKDGSLFWANVLLNAIYDEENNVIGFIKVIKHLTDRKKAEDELLKKNEQLMNATSDY
ncbi:MAG: PAS domain-containing protein [Cytophagaceae bacterium]